MELKVSRDRKWWERKMEGQVVGKKDGGAERKLKFYYSFGS